jgi:CHAT domain
MPKILVVTANSKTTPLQLSAELRGIRDALGEASNFRITHEAEIRAQDLIRRLVDEQPDILHFAGHGAGGSEQALSVITDKGETAIITKRDLGAIMESIPAKPRLIVLNACFSAELADELVKWTEVVIGADGAIGDDPARRFAVSLYRALGKSCSVHAAFTLAKTELKISGYDSDCLSLRPRPGIDAGDLMFYGHPELMASFVLNKSGTPMISDGHYHIYLWLRGTDQSADTTTFEVCHDSFKQKHRYWEVARSESVSFLTDDFWTKGDVVIRAVAWSRGRGIGIETSLATALKRHYGAKIKPEIAKAVQAVEDA